MAEKNYFTKVIDHRNLASLINLERDGLEFGRRYTPVDDDSNPTITVYHMNIGFLKGAVTVEVTERATKMALSPEYNKYEIQFRILGTKRAINSAKSKLEKITGFELVEDE